MSFVALTSRAQYLFKDLPDAASNGLGPYTQNFNALAGTKALFNSNSTLLGVYAKFTLTGVAGEFESSARSAGAQAKLGPDDGSEGPQLVSSVDADGTPHGASWYHFGAVGDNDRALGGIASTTISTGQGYVGIRLKNSSSKVIKNLEIRYAMEQWYNSSQAQAANVTVDYQRSTSAINSMVTPNAGASWVAVSALGVSAPSTSTAIAPRNGNAATNRRVLQTTLVGLNLAVNEEIMLRFGYTFNSATNGNGLSVDDVVVTPVTNIFYSSNVGTTNLDNVSAWGTNTDGSGTRPANFSAANTTYYVRGNTGSTDRINGTWAVNGANSKIVVGTGIPVGTNPPVPETADLYVNSNDLIVGTVDVGAGSTLQINQSNTNVVLGALHATSTVDYINTGITTQNVKGAAYGNLKLSGTGSKSLMGAAMVSTGLALNTTGGLALSLNDYDLLLLKGTALAGLNGANTLFVTNGRGSLRRTVSNDGVAVLFPVGTSATAYTPATLSQTQAQSEDTYSVRVAPNAYPGYDATGTGQGTAVAYQNVQKTWFVVEEVPGNSSITMGLQWNAGDAVASFRSATAHVNHFVNGAWDKSTVVVGATAGTVTGSFTVARPGITSFSPFSVSSRPDGALPVELTSFTARRAGTAVACAWATASEKNSRDFAVERSADGRTFEMLSRVAAAGSSSAPRAYAFTDEHPPRSLAYYRLRQTDLDGTEFFSPVVAVSGAAAAGEVAVVPNPGTDRFAVLAADGLLTGPGVVRNALGAVVLYLPAATPDAPTAASFDLSAQPAGVYFVQLQTATGPRTLRLLKQ